MYLSVLAVFIMMLIFRLFIYYSNSQDLISRQKLEFETRLTQDPEIKNGRQQFRVKSASGQRINITTGLSPQFQYGDILYISGKVKSNKYKGHTFYTMNFPKLQLTNNDQNFISVAAAKIRNFANDLYKKSLPPISSSLLSGMVFGGNNGLPKSFMEDLQVSGVVHVIAASGMNVTFVASALIGVLGVLFRRQIAITIAIFGVLFYAFISGFEPSISRASVMAIIAFSASLLGRQNFALASLIVTAFIMLFYQPFLILDVGFQLSFLATLGILIIKPVLDLGFKRLGPISKILGDDLGTTIAAQLATVPMLLAVFGNYGVLSILINALILWTVPILMIIGSVGLLLGFIFEPLGQVFLSLAIPILFYFQKVVQYFGNLGWTIRIPEVSVYVWVGYYFILISWVIGVKRGRMSIEQK